MEFAAEIKAFLGMGWKPEWDVGAIVDGGWGQDTRTLFADVNKVRAGSGMRRRFPTDKGDKDS